MNWAALPNWRPWDCFLKSPSYPLVSPCRSALPVHSVYTDFDCVLFLPRGTTTLTEHISFVTLIQTSKVQQRCRAVLVLKGAKVLPGFIILWIYVGTLVRPAMIRRCNWWHQRWSFVSIHLLNGLIFIFFKGFSHLFLKPLDWNNNCFPAHC